VSTGQVVVLFASAVVSGLGFGLAFLGAVAMASAGVAADERAGLLSSVFVVGYLSFSVPAIIAGVVSASVGLETVTEVYASVLIVLALTAVAGVVLRRRRAARPTQQVAPDEAEALAA
jgi:MFS family permease